MNFIKKLLYTLVWVYSVVGTIAILFFLVLPKSNDCSFNTVMYQLKDANKTNYRLNENKEFYLQGVSNFKLITLGENKFVVIYTNKSLDAGRKK